MSIPTCHVRAVVNDSEGGAPIAGARIQAQLSTYEVYEGYVVPQLVQATTDENGEAFLDLWPNQLGAAESYYTVKILAPNGKTLRTTAVIPNLPEVDLHTVAELPPYDGKNDGQLFLDAAIEAAADAIVARNEAEGFAAAAQASAESAAEDAASIHGAVDAAQAAALAAQGSATSASGSALAASGSASDASDSAAAALVSENAASGSALAAAASAGSAASSASSASGSALAASGSASTAQGAAQDAQDAASAASSDADDAAASALAAAASEGAAAGYASAAESSADAAALAAAEAGLTGAAVVGDDLIITRGDSTQYNAGNVRGPVGPQGAGINLKGNVPTVGDLPPSGNTPNDAYLVVADGHLYAWDGSSWLDIGQFQGPPGTTDYNALSNKPTLGTAAALDVPASAGGTASSGQVVRGDDPRMTDARAPTTHTHPATDISDSTSVGRSVLTAANANAARSAIGAGTSSFSGSWGDLSGKPAVIAAGADQAAARSAIDLSDTDGLSEGSTNLWFTVARVRAAVLTGLSTATNAAIAATDTVLQAFGKLQAQITATKTDVVSAAPPGAVQMFAMSSPPTGWLKANGAAVSRTTYAALFAAIGTTYGAGDGSTTFNLPELRGEFLRALDDARGVDSGRALGSTQSSQNLQHNHGVNDPGHNHVLTNNNPLMRYVGSGGNVGTPGGVELLGSAVGANASTTNISIQNSGGSEARPRNVALLACIKF